MLSDGDVANLVALNSRLFSTIQQLEQANQMFSWLLAEAMWQLSPKRRLSKVEEG